MQDAPRSVFGWILIAATSACGASSSADSGSTTADRTVVGSTYSQTCSKDQDCVAVVTGDVCTFCNSCYTTDAINIADRARLQSDVDEKKKLCTAPPPACVENCPARRAICEGGKCVHEECTAGCKARDAGSD